MSAFVEHVCQYLHTVEYQEDDVILIKDNLSSSIVNIMADSHCPLHKEVALYYIVAKCTETSGAVPELSDLYRTATELHLAYCLYRKKKIVCTGCQTAPKFRGK